MVQMCTISKIWEFALRGGFEPEMSIVLVDEHQVRSWVGGFNLGLRGDER